jgi:decaprenyl-phosphate phosphoribosyltransferase
MKRHSNLALGSLSPYVSIARPDHWIKNIFVIPGIIIALVAYPVSLGQFVFNMFLGFISVCAIASANYVLNEWLDRHFDSYHLTKQKRPAVLGLVNVYGVMVEYSVLLFIGMITGFMVSLAFGLLGLVFMLMGLIYNVAPIRTKDFPYLDVLSESVNNPIRLCFGWLMVTAVVLPPSSLILAYWFSGSFLMAAKRVAEYRSFTDAEQAGFYRTSFKFYSAEKLIASCLFYAMAASFFLGIFLIKYKIELLILFPFMIGLFSIYLFIALKPESVAQKPERLFEEKQLVKYVALLGVAFLALLFCDFPVLDVFVEKVFTIN